MNGAGDNVNTRTDDFKHFSTDGSDNHTAISFYISVIVCHCSLFSAQAVVDV
jgi:hypothetical protein